jgi:uncharacterized cupin superfamily protein
VTNIFDVALKVDEGDPEPFADVGYARIRELVGGVALGMTVYELPPGKSNCPYHYEVGNEEWVVALSGRLSVRTPEEEVELEPWDVLCFPDGEAGAHRFTNRTQEPVRFAVVSTLVDPSASVYPDSGKIGIWPPGKLFRLGDAVDYWDGEG